MMRNAEALESPEAALRPWTPILSASSPSARAAREAADAVAQAVLDGNFSDGGRPHRAEEDALLFAYMGAALGDAAWVARAPERLNAAIEHAWQRRGWAGLYGGLCGLGWAVEHVSEVLGSVDLGAAAAAPRSDPDDAVEEEDDLAEIDGAVVLELQRHGPGPWPGQYDLISGLVGHGVYFVERLPAPAAALGLKLVVDHLEAAAKTTDTGIAWFTRPELLPEWQRTRDPEGHYNLGVAHGIPGVIHLLSEAAAAGVERERVLRLLEGGVDWLLAQKRPEGSRSWFGSRVAPGQPTDDSRPTWCYGDLGIASVLLQVGRRMRRANWSRFAHDLLDYCMGSQSMDRSGIIDPALCHGALGNAHMFNRIYQSEGDPRYRDAALTWLERGLAMRKPEAAAGGFLAFRTPPDSPHSWEPSPSLLDGAIGVALALIAALTPVEPRWDRLLLLSGRSWGTEEVR
jgi:hypothetical protein